MAALLRIAVQKRLLRLHIVIVHRRQQDIDFLRHQPLFFAGYFGQPTQQGGKLPQVACIRAGEGDALPSVGGHIQRIVPIRTPEPEDVVLAHLKERRQVLNQQMLDNASAIDRAVLCALLCAIFRRPLLVYLRSPHTLRVLEIAGHLIQYGDVAGLIDVEFRRHQRPERMVHPDAGNAVAVRNEVAQPRCR